MELKVAKYKVCLPECKKLPESLCGYPTLSTVGSKATAKYIFFLRLAYPSWQWQGFDIACQIGSLSWSRIAPKE